MDGQPQQKKRKWDVPAPTLGPGTVAVPALLNQGAGVVLPAAALTPTPAVNIALAQAAAAALFSKYHPGAQARLACSFACLLCARNRMLTEFRHFSLRRLRIPYLRSGHLEPGLATHICA